MRAQVILAAMLVAGCRGEDKDTSGTDTAVDTGGLSEDCFLDSDGDGYGDAAAAGDCDASGYVEDSSDCDDNNDTINPAAAETCDGTDTNCSGDESDASDASSWYPDSDSDGYGDVSAAVSACEAPSGYIVDSSDCDDSDDTIQPGAPEACYDGVDSNCDGGDNLTGCSKSLADADAILEGVNSLDLAGYSIASAGDLNGDGNDDILVGARLEDSADADAGVAYVVYGPPSDMSLGSADVILTGAAAGDYAGIGVDGNADFDGDGNLDVVVGALNTANANGDLAGAAYVMYGPVSSMSLGSADVILSGTGSVDEAGRVVATVGDVNGDTLDDFLVGARRNDGSATDAGVAYLMYGSASASSAALDDVAVSLQGVAAGDRAGASVAAAGDIDADGLADVLVGAYRANGLADEDNVGVSYLLLGSGALSGLAAGDALSLGSADAIVYGATEKEQASEALAGAGDVNNDGYDDVIIGTQYYDGAAGDDIGIAYVMLGNLSGSLSVAAAAATLTGDAPDDAAGRSVATVGDLNEDDHSDLIVGAKEVDEGGDNAGAAYLFLGPVSGSLAMADANGAYIGDVASSQAGTAVAAAGDVNNDGDQDFMIGGSGIDGGYTYVILGGSW